MQITFQVSNYPNGCDIKLPAFVFKLHGVSTSRWRNLAKSYQLSNYVIVTYSLRGAWKRICGHSLLF